MNDADFFMGNNFFHAREIKSHIKKKVPGVDSLCLLAHIKNLQHLVKY